MDEQHNSNGQSRLDRLEGLKSLLMDGHAKFQEEYKLLLTAQVVLTDRIDRLAQMIQELSEGQKHTDERLNALIAVVDDLVRKRPPQQ